MEENYEKWKRQKRNERIRENRKEKLRGTRRKKNTLIFSFDKYATFYETHLKI